MENNKEIQGWSWLGFLFMPYYYAGYGALKKGSIFALIAGLIAGVDYTVSIVLFVITVMIGLGIAVYGGLKAKAELPIKEQMFSWKNVMVAVGVYVIAMLVSTALFSLMKSSTPKCNALDTTKLVKEIAQEQFQKMGYSPVKITLSNIRISAYDKEIDKYECASELSASSETTDYTYNGSIIYTSQATEDNGHFYVEVFGL